MENGLFNRDKTIELLSAAAILFGLYYASQTNYLLFHVFIELFSIIVAFGIFMIAWNSRRFLENDYLLLIGISYMFTGSLDLIHTMAYKGMNLFTVTGANLPTQLWIAARFTESISFLIAPAFFKHRLNAHLAVAGFALYTLVLFLAIFHWQIFPICFVEGVGLTPFKKISEYIICLTLFGCILLLFKNRHHFEITVFKLLAASLLMTIGAELFFTFYISVYGLSNRIGHFFKFVSFYLVYKALIVTCLVTPYSLMFRNLKQSEASLRERELKISTLIRNLPGMAYRCRNTRNLEMEFVSDGCRQLTGYEPETLVHDQQVSYNDIICPEDRDSVWNQLQEALSQKKPFQLQYRILTASGAIKWVLEQGTGIFSETGQTTALEGFITDISDRKNAEEERLRREKLQSVLETAGAVCHELNQPLQSLLGYAELLMRNADKDSPVYNKAKFIQNQIERMGQITKKLMNITHYKTRPYARGIRIIDIDSSSKKPDDR